MGDSLPSEQIGTFHWIKLALTSATTIKWLVLLVLGAGTVTNQSVQNAAVGLLPAWGSEESLPIPDGQVSAPTADAVGDAFRAQVKQSIRSLNAAVNANTSSINSVRNYSGALHDQVGIRVDALEDQLSASDARNYENLQAQMDVIKELVN